MERVGDPDKSSFSGVEGTETQLRCFGRGRRRMKRENWRRVIVTGDIHRFIVVKDWIWAVRGCSHSF